MCVSKVLAVVSSHFYDWVATADVVDVFVQFISNTSQHIQAVCGVVHVHCESFLGKFSLETGGKVRRFFVGTDLDKVHWFLLSFQFVNVMASVISFTCTCSL